MHLSLCALQTQEQLPLCTTAEDGSSVQTNKVRTAFDLGFLNLEYA
jgi:hypothetical protein